MPTEESELLVRPAVGDDLSEIAEVFIRARNAAVPAMPPTSRTPEAVREHVATWDLVEREVWVAVGEAVIGYAIMKRSWLDGLYVDPAHQGTGAGSLLLDAVKAVRPDGFSLWVFESNRPARAFYARHGLIELETTDGSANEERAPDVRMAWPGPEPLAFLRGEIDAVDESVAELLARRFALTAAVQDLKATPGHQGRDPERERQIAERMAEHAPGLSAEAVRRIVHTIIEESLDAYERRAGVTGTSRA